MQYRIPKLQHFHWNYVSLADAFQETGAVLFTQVWTGLEILAWPSADPEDLKNERAEVQQDYDAKLQEMHNLQALNRHISDVVGREEHQTKTEFVLEELQRLDHLLSTLPRPGDAVFEDASAYERRKAVEAKLCQAIRDKELRLFWGRGTNSAVRNGYAERSPTISFAFSLVIHAGHHGQRRRFPASFRRNEFHQWLAPMADVLEPFQSKGPVDLRIDWLKSVIQEHVSTATAPTRKTLETRFINKFPEPVGTETADRLFDAIWRLHAPEDWKKGGRRKRPDH